MLLINNPDHPNSKQTVTLGDSLVTLYFKYNSRNKSWYIDIKDSTDTDAIIDGIKVMPNQNLTGRYILNDLAGGNLWCIRNTQDYTSIDRDNLGEDKTYSIYWVTDEEEAEAGVDEYIQL